MRIDPRFQGPPGHVNGGVIAATLAGRGPAEVTIRRPVPLGVDLRVEDGRLLGGAGELLAECAPLGEEETAELDRLAAETPRVTIDEARAAGARTPLAEGHPFPGCFGCGPDHPTGLHCLAGPARDGLWAVAFTPERDAPEFAWAALDCPSSAPHAQWASGNALVLGRIAGRLLAPLRAGEPHAVVARPTGAEGRRHMSVSTILDASAEPVAVARATWVSIAR